MVEYLDIYNKDGKKTGESLPREEVHEKSLWHFSVNLWIVTPKGKILLAKRSDKKEAYPGHWAHAAAGHVPSGKTSKETIMDEAREEIGLDLKEGDLEFLFSYSKENIDFSKRVHRSHFDVYITVKDINLSDLKPDPKEVSEVKFVNTEELERMTKTPNLMLPFDYEYPKIISLLRERFEK